MLGGTRSSANIVELNVFTQLRNVKDRNEGLPVTDWL